MRSIFIVTIIILLTACSAQPAAPNMTATIPPSPTLTTTPSFTATPALSSEQQTALDAANAALNGRLTVDASGNVTDKNGETAKDFRYDTQTGELALQVNSEWVAIDPAAVSFDENGNVTGIAGFAQKDGKWVQAAKVLPVKEFPTCIFADFEKCPIAFADLQEQGRFAQSMLTEGSFNPAKIKFVDKYSVYIGQNRSYLVPDAEIKPNYPDPETAPFMKTNEWNGITEIDGKPYVTIQVPYYIEGVPADQLPVMSGVHILPDLKGNWANTRSFFDDEMNVVPWSISDSSITMATKFKNPRTGENFTRPEVMAIIEEMKVGNFANVNGLVLEFEIGRSEALK
jgi:hypothetical protein